MLCQNLGRVLHREEWTGGLSLARVGQPFFYASAIRGNASSPRPVHLPCRPTTVLALALFVAAVSVSQAEASVR